MTLAALHAAYLLAAIILITVALLVGIVLGSSWCKSVFRSWDYLGAAIFGGDGIHSISAYTGAHAYPGAAYIEPLVDGIFGKGHCAGAARKEGLLV